MQNGEKSKNGNRNKNAAPKGKADASPSGERGVHTFMAGLSEAHRNAHRGNFLVLLQSLVGSEVVIRARDGGEIQGIFNTATPFESKKSTEVVVKMARVKGGMRALENGSSVVLAIEDIAAIEVASLDLRSSKDGAASGELQADGDIAKSTKLGAAELKGLDGRDLTAIDSSWLSSDSVGALEGNKKKGSANTSWDQFEVNKRLYNVNSTYDENLYTKKLDRSELTKDQIKKAERFAKEIEGTRSSNVHLQEERGQVLEREIDEEDLYSGVIRPAAATSPGAKGPNKPSQPAGVNGSSWRRAVTGEPSSPTQAQAPPGLTKGPKGSGSPAVNKAKPAKGKAQPAVGPAGSPPGYDEEYIPVTPTGEVSQKASPVPATSRPKTPEPATSTPQSETRPESPPQISFYGVPDSKVVAPSTEPKDKAPAADDKPKPVDASADNKDAAKAAEDVAAKSKLNVNAKEFKFNANAKEFVFTPKAAATPTPAPAVTSTGTGPNAGGKFHNRRYDAGHQGNQIYNNGGYPDNGYGYGMSPMGMQQQWAPNGPMMYNNGGMVMNGPLVAPVGDMPPMGYPPYDPAFGHMGPGMMPGAYPPMHMGVPPYGAPQGHYGGRGGGRGHSGGRGRGGHNNSAAPQGDNFKARTNSQTTAEATAPAPEA